MTAIEHAHIIKYDFTKQFVEWKNHYYNTAMVSNLVGFLIFWVKNDWFIAVIEGQEFKVRIHYDGFAGWYATTDSYDGPEDHINSNWSGVSRENAFEGLIEKLDNAIAEGKI